MVTATETDCIPLKTEVFAICRRLGLNPNDVRRLDIYVDEVTADVYMLNGDGKKYVDPETDRPAVATVTYKIRTH